MLPSFFCGFGFRMRFCGVFMSRHTVKTSGALAGRPSEQNFGGVRRRRDRAAVRRLPRSSYHAGAIDKILFSGYDKLINPLLREEPGERRLKAERTSAVQLPGCAVDLQEKNGSGRARVGKERMKYHGF